MPIAALPNSIARRLLPILGWLPAYRREWLLPDFLAGLAVWAVMVPEGMAYSGIVGVPPITGLYTIVPPLIACALLGTSRLLVVGPDTATGLISALTVGAIATQYAYLHPRDPDRRLLPAFRRAAHGLGGRLHPHAGDAGIHRGPGLRHHHRPGAASAGDPRYVRQLLRQALVRPAVSVGRFARPVLTGLLSLAAMQLLRRLTPRVPAALVVAVSAVKRPV
jgi:SulP family sulfate permease